MRETRGVSGRALTAPGKFRNFVRVQTSRQKLGRCVRKIIARIAKGRRVPAHSPANPHPRSPKRSGTE